MSESPRRRGEKPLVLVAEDEAIIALELEDSLTSAGFGVAGPFSTCAEAEAWLKAGEPDAAILDNQLKDGPCDALAADLSRRGVPLSSSAGITTNVMPCVRHGVLLVLRSGTGGQPF